MSNKLKGNIMSNKLKGNIELVDYQSWRMSFRTGQNHIIADNGNCEGYLELEEEGTFRKRFFILNVDEMNFKYYRDKPKDRKNEMLGFIDIRYITKVSKVTYKPKKNNSFVINTTSTKYTLVGASETEVNNWVDALTLAAVTPSKKYSQVLPLRKSNSLESIAENNSFQTHIVGGVVVKTPTAPPSSSNVHLKLVTRRSVSSSDHPVSSDISTTGIRTLYEGWCWKQGAVMKNWKRRYFRLNAVRLSYYETNVQAKPIRSIVTHNIKGVRILNRFSNRDNCLEVETPNRKFYMHPECKSDVREWKDVLEDVIKQTGMSLPRTKSI